MTFSLRFLPILSFALTFSTAAAIAAPPRIFFSDLESGPKSSGEKGQGAFVTIYGKGFGASQGSSRVTIGGGQAGAYPVWTDTKVTFQLGSAAATGDIVITNSAGSSNGVP